MAVSKVQPMREAEIDLIDLANQTEATLEETNVVVGQLSREIGSEIERATAAEEVLRGSITSEAERAMAAEEVLRGSITSEAERAMAAEEVLREDVSAIPVIDYGFTDPIELEAGASIAGGVRFNSEKESAPTVICTVQDVTENPEIHTAAQNITIYDVTTTGFAYTITNGSGTYATSLEINWIALGA